MSYVATGSGIYVLGQSGLAVSCGADTTEDTLATITVPANSMGANGMLTIITNWNYTNSSNTKTLKVYWGGLAGTLLVNAAQTTTLSASFLKNLWNAGVTNSQVAQPITFTSYGANTSAIITAAIDTTAATTIVITGQKASAGETLTLLGYSVSISPRP